MRQKSQEKEEILLEPLEHFMRGYTA